MRKLVALAVLVLLGSAPWAVPTASAGTHYCGNRWDTLPKTANMHTYTTATLTGLRAGQHPCFDRFVIDLGAPATPVGYRVAYGPQPRDERTGQPVPMAGGAFLAIILNAAGHDGWYNPTYTPADRLHAVDVTSFRTLRQVAYFGTYEAQATLVLGVRAQLPFRVSPGVGSRVVVDIAHQLRG